MVMLVGCSAEREAQIPVPPTPTGIDRILSKEDLLNRLIQREAKVKRLKALQIVRLLDPQGGRSLHAQGYLALQKPDQYRLRLYTAVGVTLLDFVHTHNGFRFRMPMKGTDISGKKDDAAEKIPYFPADALREAFVHNYNADRLEWHRHEQGHLLILHHDGKGIHKTYRWIDRDTLTLFREVYFREGEEILSIDYSDYRTYAEEGDLLLPHRIDVKLPNEGPLMEIEVIEYEVNPIFKERLFNLNP